MRVFIVSHTRVRRAIEDLLSEYGVDPGWKKTESFREALANPKKASSSLRLPLVGVSNPGRLGGSDRRGNFVSEEGFRRKGSNIRPSVRGREGPAVSSYRELREMIHRPYRYGVAITEAEHLKIWGFERLPSLEYQDAG